ncbi:M15 family metallopeptidase [Nocardioides sp. W7]|uniref:M15 family metallopeptidase n=1 Tax=Nocardioides sp. W7 TaxID=2931390 RepID=UPI001FD5E788|nr:M15 family metallopeptidase [Nocardioides sp. W7]
MHLGRHLFLVLLALAVAGGVLAGPASAATPTTLTVSAAAHPADADAAVQLDLRTSTGVPVPGAVLSVERRVQGVWQPVGSLVTDAAGHAQLSARVGRLAPDNLFRASYAGDATYDPATGSGAIPITRRPSRLLLDAAKRVVDGRATTVRVRWRTTAGQPVAGGRITLLRKAPGERRWRRVTTLTADARGRATLRARPRADTVWIAKGATNDWVRGDTSARRRIDNRPPGRPVSLPKGAPRPRVGLPRQQRAVGRGANATITPIPDQVWGTMTGRSWHAGCPVGRSGLRLVRVNYWGYDGYRYRGELVAAADAADNMAGALAEFYRRQLPIRAMYRVDRFGWSGRLGGADDYRSMAADNSSAFNCRSVVGRPGVRSPHSYGRSLDINPWENPYHSRQGVVPNGWWLRHSHPLVAWRSRSHEVVQVMARHGLRWTYGTRDAHHFDVVGSAGRALRTDLSPRRLHPQCAGFVCD